MSSVICGPSGFGNVSRISPGLSSGEIGMFKIEIRIAKVRYFEDNVGTRFDAQ